MMTRRTMMSVALAMCAVALHVPTAQAAEDVDASCARHDLQLSLAPGGDTYHVVGWLCADSPTDGETVILASPSGFSTHAYWDWPVEKDTYSFVRAAVRAGYAVFNYDRIGTGLSERPPAALVDLRSEAYLQDQIVTSLREGGIGGTEFGSVVLAGNSLSTLINIFQAEVHGGVDGLINTGIFVGPSPVGLATLFASFYPAQFDPKFADDPSIPLGYATTMPGTRANFFHLQASDPDVIAMDEALKETATVGEAATFGAWYPLTRTVDVPILSVVGDHDVLACIDVCEPGGIEETKERLAWGAQTCLEIEILPDVGHFIQLQPNGAAPFHGLAFDWLARRIGSGATEPCTA